MHMVVTLTVRWFAVRIRDCPSTQPELQHHRHTDVVTEVMQMGATPQSICRAVVRAGAAVAQGSEGEADGL